MKSGYSAIKDVKHVFLKMHGIHSKSNPVTVGDKVTSEKE
jgi:hypothetical protein